MSNEVNLKETADNRRNLVVILNNIRSCFNVGSIFRTCDGLGVDKVYLAGYTADPISNTKIKKTSLGAEMFVPWERRENLTNLIKELKLSGYEVCALELDDKSQDIADSKFDRPTALILGNEVDGISKRILGLVDKTVCIPMQGKKESLNVAVAFGIAAFVIQNRKF